MQSFKEGEDYNIENTSELPYQYLDKLGHGQSGNVSKVKDINTGDIFACKTIRIFASRKNDNRRRIFDNEISIIRSLKGHRHVVRVFATYVSRREVGLFLQPVANQGDLEDFLDDYTDTDHTFPLTAEMSEDTKVLLRAFGCLADGLAFMHQQKVRHKDIKPRNILIHDGMVVYTDFGYSLDSTALGHSTTEGRPEAYTRKYAAPEVLDYEPRNSRSDIFSLGCVFLEIFSALSQTIDVTSLECLSEHIESWHAQLEEATTAVLSSLKFIIPLIISMTERVSSRRSTAQQVADSLLEKAAFCCVYCRKFLLVPGMSRKMTLADLNCSIRSRRTIISDLEILERDCDVLHQKQSVFLQRLPCSQAVSEITACVSTYMDVQAKISELRSELQLFNEQLDSPQPNLSSQVSSRKWISSFTCSPRWTKSSLVGDWLQDNWQHGKLEQLLRSNIVMESAATEDIYENAQEMWMNDEWDGVPAIRCGDDVGSSFSEDVTFVSEMEPPTMFLSCFPQLRSSESFNQNAEEEDEENKSTDRSIAPEGIDILGLFGLFNNSSLDVDSDVPTDLLL